MVCVWTARTPLYFRRIENPYPFPKMESRGLGIGT